MDDQELGIFRNFSAAWHEKEAIANHGTHLGRICRAHFERIQSGILDDMLVSEIENICEYVRMREQHRIDDLS